MKAIRMLVATALVLVAMPMAAQGGMGGGQGGMGGGQRGMGGGQGGQGRGAMQQRQNEMLFRGITLTEAQRAKVDTLQAAQRTAMQEMMRSGAMQDPAARERIAEMRTKHNNDLRAVLTPEQRTQFDKNLAEMPARGPGGPGGARPPR
jgi:Spy/CpxP family protein refolding chaperone